MYLNKYFDLATFYYLFKIAFLFCRFERRLIILLSLYASIVFNIISAVIHNYLTLLLSRALIGITVGLNVNVVAIFLSEGVSSKRVGQQVISVLSLTLAAGAGWVAVLGYFLIEPMGWRMFVVCTSIPLAVPAIVMLHFCFESKEEINVTSTETVKENDAGHGGNLVGDNEYGSDENKQLIGEEKIVVTDLISRTVKASIFCGINRIQGHGAILLLPSLIRDSNKHNGIQKCGGAIHGTQYLIIALISGVTNIAGRILGYFLKGRVSFGISQTSFAVLLVACYGFLLVKLGEVSMEIAMGLIKIAFAAMTLESYYLLADSFYFGTETLGTYAGISTAAGFFGSAVGMALAAFLDPYVAVACTLVMSTIQIVVVLSLRKMR